MGSLSADIGSVRVVQHPRRLCAECAHAFSFTGIPLHSEYYRYGYRVCTGNGPKHECPPDSDPRTRRAERDTHLSQDPSDLVDRQPHNRSARTNPPSIPSFSPYPSGQRQPKVFFAPPVSVQFRWIVAELLHIPTPLR